MIVQISVKDSKKKKKKKNIKGNYAVRHGHTFSSQILASDDVTTSHNLDLKVFASFNEELFKEITRLLTLDNFRQNEQLSKIQKFTTEDINKPEVILESFHMADGARPPPTNCPLVGPIPKAGAFSPIGAHGTVVSPSPGAVAGWMSNNSLSLPHLAVAAGPSLVQSSSAAAFLKHPRTLTGMTGMDYQSADSEHLTKRICIGQSDDVSFAGVSRTPNVYSQDDLTKAFVQTINQGSNVMSMDFHPQQQAILLVGTIVGDISLGDVGSQERLAHKSFKVWDILAASMPLQINAHVAGVNDIAFAHSNKQLFIVTCGDDKTIKVWDAVAGRGKYMFEGHEAPVYSFVFSTAIDGK
ncbi:hypothetical protein Patl1_24445 [Pistacia atlantica]|uniref:Uncharacterized protein n=1 Tax=Pistacia atlantica TaxID=434234 RepID=A0ACC1A0E3_9ROSI|nr:hypothetical protein Patl1_24445 [Pistacia atlantica]